MRLLSGGFRGKEIVVPKGIRPLSSRVKRSLVDMLSQIFDNAYVLDLFAGSGALGLEALSNGAKTAVFVEKMAKNVQILKKNCKNCKVLDFCEVLNKDAFDFLEGLKGANLHFDLIFIDPPYYQDAPRKALQMIGAYDILSPSGYIIVLCYYKEQPDNSCGDLSLVSSKKYGQTKLLIYEKNEKSNLSGDI